MSTPTDQALTLCTEHGIVTSEAQKKISVAVAAAAQVPIVRRTLTRIDRTLDARLPSPVRQAREALSSLQSVWAGATDLFHAFRQQAFEVRLLQAKLAKKKKHPPEDPEDMEIWEAECAAEQAKIDALTASMHARRGAVEQIVAKATFYADQYAKLGTTVTTEDFLLDDASYLVQSAFWHAARTFSLLSPGDAGRSESQKWRDAVVRTPADVRMYFKVLGITPQEGNDLLKDLADQKRLYALGYTQSGQAAPPFEYDIPWLTKCATLFAPRVLALMKSNGPEWAERVQHIINPETPDAGKEPTTPKHWQLDRDVILE